MVVTETLCPHHIRIKQAIIKPSFCQETQSRGATKRPNRLFCMHRCFMRLAEWCVVVCVFVREQVRRQITHMVNRPDAIVDLA